MLTRKQQWRKQKRTINRSQYDYLYSQGLESENSHNDQIPHRSSSEPSLSLLNLSILGRLWSTTGNLEIKQKCKSVRFSNAVHFVLIPTRDEYCKAGLDSLLWWIREDYTFFKHTAVSELRNLMLLDSRIDSKIAQLILYQPVVSVEHVRIKSMLKNLSHHSALRDLFIENIQQIPHDNNTVPKPCLLYLSQEFSTCSDDQLDINMESSESKETSPSCIQSVSKINSSLFSNNVTMEIPLFIKRVLSDIDLSQISKNKCKSIRKCNSIDSLEQYVDRFKDQERIKSPKLKDKEIPVHPLAYICSQ